jgi:hypothetical protein
MSIVEYLCWYCSTYNATVLYPVSDFIENVSYLEAQGLVGCSRGTPCPTGFGRNNTYYIEWLDDGIRKEKKIDRFDSILS